jgi:pimeloyl-ACP methyl ester carboxylesterase
MLTGEIDGYLTYYDIDDFTDPWKEPEMVLLYHGLGRTVDVWYGWVPILARRYRVLRTDYRGHGRSAPPRVGYPWSLETLAREAKLLLDRLAVRRIHWVGESLGGNVGIQFALDYPDRLASLTLCSTPYRYPGAVQDKVRQWSKQLQQMTVKEWYLYDTATRFDPDKDDQQMIQFALDYPDRLASLTLCSTPYRYPGAVQDKVRQWSKQLQQMTVKEWYLYDTATRFDPDKDDQQMIQWFADLVGRTDVDVIRAISRFLPSVMVCRSGRTHRR